MTTTLPPPSEAPAKGLAGRIFGVLTSPRATYADIAARPRWFGGLVVILVATLLPTVIFLSTSVGQQAVLDQQLQTVESFGRTMTDAQYQQMQRIAPYSVYFAAAGQIVGLPLAAIAVSGLAYVVFSAAMGGDAKFAQIFAVVLFSGVVSALRALFSMPLDYARETLASPTSLSALIPFFADNTFAARLLGSIDLFLIWWIVNLAIGFGVLYRRRTTPIATTMLIVYGALAVGLAAIRSLLAGAS